MSVLKGAPVHGINPALPSIPGGYILGRLSTGQGQVELIPASTFLGTNGYISGGYAGQVLNSQGPGTRPAWGQEILGAPGTAPNNNGFSGAIVNIVGGPGATGNFDGGDVWITAGVSHGTGNPGGVIISSGPTPGNQPAFPGAYMAVYANSTTLNYGGNWFLEGGQTGGSAGSNTSTCSLIGTSGAGGTDIGGPINITAGSSALSTGGELSLLGGQGGAANGATGGEVLLQGGAGATSGGHNTNGGNVVIAGGLHNAGGTDGTVSITGSSISIGGISYPTSAGTSGGIPYYNSTTSLASSALLTNHALVVGGGAGAAPATLSSLGTTTTVLHGNATGNPTFGAVALTTDVSGILPVANGGTNVATASANTVFAGPTTGAAAAPGFRALVGADLPNPSATTLGGIESLASASHKWINTISTSGVPSATQPASTDLSDLPIPTTSGGTGMSSGSAGNPLYWSSSSVIANYSHMSLGSSAVTVTYNAGTPTAGATAPQVQIVAPNSTANILELDSAASRNGILGFRTEGTIASPTATAASAIIQQIAAQSYDNTPARTGTMAAVNLETINAQTSTDHSSQIVFQTTPTSSTTLGTVATFTSQGCAILGSNTNDSASAGYVGEYASTIVLQASEVSINAAANVCTLQLTAGDWDVQGELWVDTSTGTATVSGRTRAGITTSSATIPTVPADGTGLHILNVAPQSAALADFVLPVGPVRVSLAMTTNVYLVGNCAVSAGTANGYGKISARRMR